LKFIWKLKKEKSHMLKIKVQRLDKRGVAVLALLLGSSFAVAGDGVDNALSGWLDKEMEITNTTIKDEIPVGGKFTLVYDSSKDEVQLCTKQDAEQQKLWHSDLAKPCGVTLTFTRGTHYCSDADVKTGNSEILASCHRLRSREVAMSKPSDNGVERSDMIVFLVESNNGKKDVTILVDSPSRVTAGGSAGTGVGNGDGNGGGG
jgi:hypothetical protein